MPTVTQVAGISYRTKCLPKPQAARFASCLTATPRFNEICISESHRAKGDACWFVPFKPISEERQADMAARQQVPREERQVEVLSRGILLGMTVQEFLWAWRNRRDPAT